MNNPVIDRTLSLLPWLLAVAVALVGLFASPTPSLSQGVEIEPDWTVFAYGGKWSDNRYGEIIRTTTELRDSHLWVAGMSRSLIRFYPHLQLEGEWNLGRHTGRQDHFEMNAALSLRWNTFPWDDYLDTSFAHGIGPSYAFSRPPIEDDSDKKAERLLLFMQTELAVSPPAPGGSRWAWFVRIHHRSGIFGVLSDASGSNFLTTGIRFKFR